MRRTALSTIAFGLLGAGGLIGCAEPALEEAQVIGGRDLTIDQAPWQVSIQQVGWPDVLAHSCGGSILDELHVLTAAHCFRTFPDAERVIVAGDADRRGRSDDAQRIAIASVALHDGFRHEAYAPAGAVPLMVDDLAMITLAAPLDLDGAARPIGLVEAVDATTLTAPGAPAQISGWGRDGDGLLSTVRTPTTLQGATLDLLDNVDAGLLLSEAKSVDGVTVPGTVLGAQADDQGACHGDSGGPLVVFDDAGTPWLAGVASFAHMEESTFGLPIDCAIEFGTYYTRVSSYGAWIAAALDD